MSEVDDLLADHEALMASYDVRQAEHAEIKAAHGGDTSHPDVVAAREKFDAAQIALVNKRRYWREVGETVDRGHDGARTPSVPKVTNNDGSVPA